MAPETTKAGSRKRGKYGRPCDTCSARRIRCIYRPNATKCAGCSSQGTECTYVRVRKKLGPKPARDRQPMEPVIQESVPTSSLSLLDQLLLFTDTPLRLAPRYIPLHTRDSLDDAPQFASRLGFNPHATPALTFLSHLTPESYPTVISHDSGSFDLAEPRGPPPPPNLRHIHPRVGSLPPSMELGETGIPPGLLPGVRSEIPHGASPGVPPPLSEGEPPINSGGSLMSAQPSVGIPTVETPPEYASIPVDKLLPCLQVYQTWFYGYWPVLSVADLMLTLVGNSDMDELCNYFLLTERNAMSYALCCAVCATILTQMTFVLSKIKLLNIHAYLPAEQYAADAKRVRHLFDYTSSPDVTTLLTSFFLYTHYVNVKGKTGQAIMYLREAITACQLLGLHEPTTYVNKSSAEVHRYKKIFYMLIVTERFMCFEDGLPVILDPVIEIPSLQNEEYPSLLVGFTELVRIFAVPSKGFFGQLNQNRGNLDLVAFRHTTQDKAIEEKKLWVMNVHRKLNEPLSDAIQVSDSQKLNIVLSKAWIQAIAWHIASDDGLISQTPDSLNYLSVQFPLKIVNEFLLAVEHLPLFAFESNGPGICVKLLAIANSLNRAFLHNRGNVLMVDRLNTIFSLVTRYKNDVSLPTDIYISVATTILNVKTTVPRRLAPTDYENTKIEEIIDSEDKSELLFPEQELIGQVGRVGQVGQVGQTGSNAQVLPMYKDTALMSPGDTLSGIIFNPIMHTPGDCDALKSKTNSALSIMDLMHAFALDKLTQNRSDAYTHMSPGFLP